MYYLFKKMEIVFIFKIISFNIVFYTLVYLVIHLQGNIEISNTEKKMIFIQLNKNRGYIAENNIGIKYALKNNNCKFIWILNNDVIVELDSLKNIVITMKKDKSLEMCG